MPRPERPLGPGEDAVLRFAHELRLLRKKAGTPTYRQLARRAHYSAGTLSEAAGGRKLPTLEVALAYVRACDGDEPAWRDQWHAAAAELQPEQPGPDTDAGAAPYVGLRAFAPDDTGKFFGRERLVRQLSERLDQERLLLLLGPSGAGKSSILAAGLLPALRARRDRVAVLITPGARPLRECAAALAELLGVTPGGLLAEFTGDVGALGLAMRQAVTALGPSAEFVLIVDQLEEIFTLCRDPLERRQFLTALADAAAEAGSRARVVLGGRIDFYGQLGQFEDLLAATRDAHILVPPMSAKELRQAITAPAVNAGYRVESALLAQLIADSTQQPGVLPLLSHALLETWRHRRGNTLTLQGYESSGGIGGAISRTSERVYLSLTAAQQTIVRQIFLRLTALGEGTEDTRREVTRDELEVDSPDIAPVIARLAEARLITLDQRGITIAHEALIRHWPRLREWLTEDRDALRVQRRLTEAANAWEAVDRDAGSLLRGAHLVTAREWAAAGGGSVLTARERRFLDASRAAEAEERSTARRRVNRLRALNLSLAVLLILALAATFHAWRAESEAADQRNLALSQKIAGQAAKLRMTNPALAAQLSLAAYRLNPTIEARSSLLGVFGTPYSVQLLGHVNNINAVAYRPDGKLLVTAAWDNTVRLWDVANSRRPLQIAMITGHTDNVLSVAFSPDGRTLASASWDRTIRLWDVTDPRHPGELAVIAGHAGKVLAASFSPDGAVLASAGSDRMMRLWNVTDRRHPTPAGEAAGHTGNVVAVAFSPDGRVLATAGQDRTARLWDLASSPRLKPLPVLSTTAEHVNDLAFSPNGQLLATADNDGRAHLWDLSDREKPVELATLTGHTDALRSIAFAADGRMLATAGADRTVRLWSTADPRRPYGVTTLTGHTSTVVAVAFGPDGHSLATGGDDFAVRIWETPGPIATHRVGGVCGLRFTSDGRTLISTGRDGVPQVTDLSARRGSTMLAGHTARACGLTLGPDDRTLVTGSSDHTVRKWDLRNPATAQTVIRHHDDLDAVAFSPDGTLLAAAGDNHTVALLDMRGHRNPVTLSGHTDDVHAISFSPGGKVVATAGWDRTIRLWDIGIPGRPAQLAVLTGHAQAVLAVAISPDGRTMATSSPDRTLRLWDITNPRVPHESGLLTGHTDTVRAVAFSPDTRTLASAADDRTVRLWNLEDHTEAAVLDAHTDRVRAVAYSPDGHTLATGGMEGTTLLWETDSERVATRICETAIPRITAEEWHRYVHGLEYTPPCP